MDKQAQAAFERGFMEKLAALSRGHGLLEALRTLQAAGKGGQMIRATSPRTLQESMTMPMGATTVDSLLQSLSAGGKSFQAFRDAQYAPLLRRVPGYFPELDRATPYLAEYARAARNMLKGKPAGVESIRAAS